MRPQTKFHFAKKKILCILHLLFLISNQYQASVLKIAYVFKVLISIFVTMPLPSSIYVVCICDLFFIFPLIFIIINHIITLKQTLRTKCSYSEFFWYFYVVRHTYFLHIFQNISNQFWMITWMKKVNSFQITKVQSQGVAQLLLGFFANFNLALLLKMLLI